MISSPCVNFVGSLPRAGRAQLAGRAAAARFREVVGKERGS